MSDRQSINGPTWLARKFPGFIFYSNKDSGRIDPSKPVKVSFGEPVHISGNGKAKHRFNVDFIRTKLAGWQS